MLTFVVLRRTTEVVPPLLMKYSKGGPWILYATFSAPIKILRGLPASPPVPGDIGLTQVDITVTLLLENAVDVSAIAKFTS